MSSASHRGVDGPIVTGQMASAFMSNRDDDAADILLQTDRDRLNELHAEVTEPSANALPMTPVRAGRHGTAERAPAGSQQRPVSLSPAGRSHKRGASREPSISRTAPTGPAPAPETETEQAISALTERVKELELRQNKAFFSSSTKKLTILIEKLSFKVKTSTSVSYLLTSPSFRQRRTF